MRFSLFRVQGYRVQGVWFWGLQGLAVFFFERSHAALHKGCIRVAFRCIKVLEEF